MGKSEFLRTHVKIITKQKLSKNNSSFMHSQDKGITMVKDNIHIIDST